MKRWVMFGLALLTSASRFTLGRHVISTKAIEADLLRFDIVVLLLRLHTSVFCALPEDMVPFAQWAHWLLRQLVFSLG